MTNENEMSRRNVDERTTSLVRELELELAKLPTRVLALLAGHVQESAERLSAMEVIGRAPTGVIIGEIIGQMFSRGQLPKTTPPPAQLPRESDPPG